jgi:UDP-N-acetylmuramoyl-tripeptide--D-alanyl-D-alanine ligase
VLNADDPLVLAMSSRTSAKVVTYGEAADADVRADDVDLDDGGRPSFTLVAGGRTAPVRLGVHGRHQVSNALATAGVALALGLDLDQVAGTLSLARPASRWRGDVTDTASGATVVNDAYNANPGSMVAALELLAAMTRATPTRAARRAVAVLGEMLELGDRSVHEHGVIGRAAVRLGVARLVVVGDGESVQEMRDAAHEAGGTATLVRDVEAAVTLLGAELEPGDVVLVKASRSVGLERVAAALLDGSAAHVDEAHA